MEGNSQGKRRLTIREAAALQGVHYNTVRNWIKDGAIEAEKVVTERGPTWMIDPDSLTNNTLPSTSQQLVGRVPEETLTALAREIVREAGLQRSPTDDRLQRAAQYFEAMRGTWTLQSDAAKHTSTTSGVLLLVLGAFVGVIYPDLLLPTLAYVAAALLSIAAIGSIVVMNQVSYIILHHIAEDVSVLESAARQAEESQPEEDDEQALKLAAGLKRRTWWFTWLSRTTMAALVAGAVCFLAFAFYNLAGGL